MCKSAKSSNSRLFYAFFVVVSCEDFESFSLSLCSDLEPAPLSAKNGMLGIGKSLVASSIVFDDGTKDPIPKFEDAGSFSF